MHSERRRNIDILLRVLRERQGWSGTRTRRLDTRKRTSETNPAPESSWISVGDNDVFPPDIVRPSTQSRSLRLSSVAIVSWNPAVASLTTSALVVSWGGFTLLWKNEVILLVC